MLQLHIEQGPVLEWIGFPLGVVKGIAGQTRMKVITFLSKYMHKLLKTYLLHYPFYYCGLTIHKDVRGLVQNLSY